VPHRRYTVVVPSVSIKCNDLVKGSEQDS
jgi:hypothetical protein